MQSLLYCHILGEKFRYIKLICSCFFSFSPFISCLFFFFFLMTPRYDMEDAMILNKSSVDRGMFHGLIYQVLFLAVL